jgi:NAD+ diphosphatase
VTYPHIALSQGAHDRTGLQRNDEVWLAQAWADPGTRVLVLAGARLRESDGRALWVSPSETPDGLRVLLGETRGIAHFAVLLEDVPEPVGEWHGLRTIVQAYADGDATDAPLVFHAMGIAEWHHATRHCPRCGGVLVSRSAGHELECTQCHRLQFPRTDPAVIMVVTSGEPGSESERCLLGRQASWPPGRYSTLAGFVEPGESLEDAVRREVLEEVGVRVGAVDYFGNQPWPFPQSLMLGFVARAETTEVDVDGAEIEDARWFTRTEMGAGAEAGSLVLPGGVSISRSLVEHWYGGTLPGRW